MFRYLLLLLRSRGFTRSDLSTCRRVLGHCYLGDWFVLYQLSKNSNSYFFRYFLKHLEKSFVSQVILLSVSFRLQYTPPYPGQSQTLHHHQQSQQPPQVLWWCRQEDNQWCWTGGGGEEDDWAAGQHGGGGDRVRGGCRPGDWNIMLYLIIVWAKFIQDEI